jgi:hypothetical protein
MTRLYERGLGRPRLSLHRLAVIALIMGFNCYHNVLIANHSCTLGAVPENQGSSWQRLCEGDDIWTQIVNIVLLGTDQSGEVGG